MRRILTVSSSTCATAVLLELGALPLKAMSENKQVRFESVARSIKKEVLREDMFLLPKF